MEARSYLVRLGPSGRKKSDRHWLSDLLFNSVVLFPLELHPLPDPVAVRFRIPLGTLHIGHGPIFGSFP